MDNYINEFLNSSAWIKRTVWFIIITIGTTCLLYKQNIIEEVVFQITIILSFVSMMGLLVYLYNIGQKLNSLESFINERFSKRIKLKSEYSYSWNNKKILGLDFIDTQDRKLIRRIERPITETEFDDLLYSVKSRLLNKDSFKYFNERYGKTYQIINKGVILIFQKDKTFIASFDTDLWGKGEKVEEIVSILDKRGSIPYYF